MILADILGISYLATAATCHTVVIVVAVKTAGKDSGIGVAGRGCGDTVGDRGAVEYYRLLYGIVLCGSDIVTLYLCIKYLCGDRQIDLYLLSAVLKAELIFKDAKVGRTVGSLIVTVDIYVTACGTANGLPIGAQLMAAEGNDALLYRMAAAIEEVRA